MSILLLFLKKYIRFIKKSSLMKIILITFLVIALGSIGLFISENGKNDNIDSIGDALWWSIVTISTVGYGDIYPTSMLGRIIGIITMILGIGFLGMFTATLASFLIERKMREDRGLKPLRNLKDHIIICGWNAFAKEVISEIHADQKDKEVVIVAELGEKPVDWEHVHFVCGDPSDITRLEMACFKTASAAVVLHDESKQIEHGDGEAILTVLAIKRENPSIYVCAQLMDENNVVHCKRAGADEIIVTGGLTAKLLGQAVLDHGVTKVISEILSNQYGNELYKVKCHKDFYGRDFISVLADFKRRYDGIILGIERKGQLITNPKSNTELMDGDMLIIVAERRPMIE